MSIPTPQPVPIRQTDWPSRAIAIIAVLILVYVQFFPHANSPQAISGNLEITVHQASPNPDPPHPKPIPDPSPASDMTTIGHNFGVTLAGTYADAWEAAANDIESGKSMDDMETDLLSTWKTARSAALARDVVPMFAAIIPRDSTPTTANRPKWVKAARDFATGLRGVK